MPTPADTPEEPADLTQLIRFVLVIADIDQPDGPGRVRQVLTGLGLIVDQVHADGAEVAATQVGGAGVEAIRAALATAGFRLVEATAEAG